MDYDTQTHIVNEDGVDEPGDDTDDDEEGLMNEGDEAAETEEEDL